MKDSMNDSMNDFRDPTFLSQEIRRQAQSEGFDKVGIVRAEPLVDEKVLLDEWLRRGYQGEMGWMARDPTQRTDPRLLFPEARSVVVVVLNYFTPHQHRQESGTGKISRYAWGDDYHLVVGEKLKSLLAWIKQKRPDADGKTCVDIQPMMDKVWAARAGLGWIGKHTNLITRELGSWVFIGELLLNIELSYDTKREEDYCGSCTICLDECPTGAIVEPYVVDSNKCISYATIELRAPQIPDEVAQDLDGWVYGCDVCQDVCPWNRFQAVTDEKRFEPRPGNVSANLSDILELSDDAYAERFRGSAIKRAKLSGLKRNALALLEPNEATKSK
jgi:epoxyqueuosine reductase